MTELVSSLSRFSWLVFHIYCILSQLFLEQKKIFKTGLNTGRFRQHIPMIEEETMNYFKQWGNAGERGELTEF